MYCSELRLAYTEGPFHPQKGSSWPTWTFT